MKVTWELTVIAGETGHEDFTARDETGRIVGRVYRQIGGHQAGEWFWCMNASRPVPRFGPFRRRRFDRATTSGLVFRQGLPTLATAGLGPLAFSRRTEVGHCGRFLELGDSTQHLAHENGGWRSVMATRATHGRLKNAIVIPGA